MSILALACLLASAQVAPEESAMRFPVPGERDPSEKIQSLSPEGPNIGGFLLATGAVVALMGGAFWLLKRFGRGARFLNGGGTIRVLSRRSLGARQELFLIEVGRKAFLVGATRDRLTTLGAFSDPDAVAALRADASAGREVSSGKSFRESLHEGLRDEETAPQGAGRRPAQTKRSFVAIVGEELAGMRRKIQGWKA